MKLNGKIMDFFLLHLVVAHKVKPLIKILLIVSDNCDVYSLTAKELEYISKIILLENLRITSITVEPITQAYKG